MTAHSREKSEKRQRLTLVVLLVTLLVPVSVLAQAKKAPNKNADSSVENQHPKSRQTAQGKGGKKHRPDRIVSVAVMEFSSKGGVDQNQTDALCDMLANEIRSIGNFRVIGKSDIQAALNIEEQKMLMGCSDNSCIAEIGGALGVRWIISGNVSLFGKTWLLNLKLMDVEKVEVASSFSRTIKGEQDILIGLLYEAVGVLFSDAQDKIGIEITIKKRPKVEAVPEIVATPKSIPEARAPKIEKQAKAQPQAGWFDRPRESGWNLRINFGPVFFSQFRVEDDFGFDCPGEGEHTVDCLNLAGAEETLSDQERNGGGLGVSLGYTFNRWLTFYAQLGGFVVSGESNNDDSRNMFEVGISAGAALAWPTDTWIEPSLYVELGYSSMADDLDKGKFSDARVSGTGVAFNMGVGLDFYLYADWFVGLRTGVMFRSWGQDIVVQSDGPGFHLMASSGWMF
jgi:TolB-like protein